MKISTVVVDTKSNCGTDDMDKAAILTRSTYKDCLCFKMRNIRKSQFTR